MTSWLKGRTPLFFLISGLIAVVLVAGIIIAIVQYEASARVARQTSVAFSAAKVAATDGQYAQALADLEAVPAGSTRYSLAVRDEQVLKQAVLYELLATKTGKVIQTLDTDTNQFWSDFDALAPYLNTAWNDYNNGYSDTTDLNGAIAGYVSSLGSDTNTMTTDLNSLQQVYGEAQVQTSVGAQGTLHQAVSIATTMVNDASQMSANTSNMETELGTGASSGANYSDINAMISQNNNLLTIVGDDQTTVISLLKQYQAHMTALTEADVSNLTY